MTKKPLILCVDDDPDDRDLVVEVLKDLAPSAQLVEFSNGREVLDYLNTLAEGELFPNLIILDMNMPVVDGRVAVSVLKGSPKTSSIPIVVFTTSNSPIDQQFCKQRGVEMVTKPPTFEALRTAVQHFLSYVH